MQRFYGGQIDWLNIPFVLLNSYITMLPIIQAEESLWQVQTIGVGSATYGEKSDRTKIIKQLTKVAEQRDNKKPEISSEARNAMLSSVGFGVINMKDKGVPKKYKKKLFPFNPVENQD